MKAIRKFIDQLRNQNRPFKERTFMLLTVLAIVAALIALIGDIVFKENIVEIIVLTVTVVITPVITFTSIYIHKVDAALRLVVVWLVFVVVPVLFIFGGGVNGGAIAWIIFSYLYIGLVMNGVWRRVMIVILSAVTMGLFVLAFYHPEKIYRHTRVAGLYDACLSTILVGLVIFYMVWFQTRMLKAETKRAIEQTEKAEELNRSQNRFFSSMSHEIRTPINTVLGLNEIILRQEDASEEIRRDAMNIQGAGKMLLAIINDILDFSKIEAGSMDIVPVEYQVGELISDIVNMIWLKAQEKGLLFTVDIDPGVPSELYGDEVRIKQILINLLNNAVKYTHLGYVTLHMESESIGENEVLLEISVSDTGIGIKQEVLPYLFDAFRREDQEKNRSIEGTGLGLSIVKQLVDLMGGTITVNSVYTRGSTFSVSIKQGIITAKPIGNINIENTANAGAVKYEHSFRAPEAAVLIVDDNEMNLQVEEKLLEGTEMMVDLAISGSDALLNTVKKKYDLIFMDHLMPIMDGIECLECIRRQPGGLNRDTPVVVLTANAGADNKKLYNKSGFDGYLIKPVSGKQLEQCLMKNLPDEKLILNGEDELTHETIETAKGYMRKKPVQITTSTMSDLPESVMREQQIEQIPFMVRTKEGVFFDGIEAVSDELINYINTQGGSVQSEPPSVSEFTEFFAGILRTAQHIIHITITSSMSEEYKRATEAAKAFDNVTIIDSQMLSSATGILVLIACRLASQNYTVDEITEELKKARKIINCSFVIADTEFMKRRGFISPAVSRFMNSMTIRPALAVKNNKFGVDMFWMGSKTYCYGKYIERALPLHAHPDKGLLFITYADVTEDELVWIEEKVRERCEFDMVVFQKASAGISSNCGPGTFGLLYITRNDTGYNLVNMIGHEGRYINEDYEGNEENADRQNETYTSENVAEAAKAPYVDTFDMTADSIAAEQKWYENIPGIDPAAAIKNSGSEEAFKSVLQVFYDSIPIKHREITELYEKEDWENYTIKVHALKSSARLIGALDLGMRAEKLEMAGKSRDTDFIKSNTGSFLSDYLNYREFLKAYCGQAEDEEKSKKPVADMSLMDSLYEMLGEAAEDMDADAIEDAFKEMEDYSIPDSEKEKYEELKLKYSMFDYEGITAILKR